MLHKTLLALLFTAVLATPALAQTYIPHQPVLRLSPAKIGAAYVTLENPGDQPDKLDGAKAGWARLVELHQSRMGDDGVMTMKRVSFIDLPAKGKMTLEQGGYHLMVFGVDKMPAIGSKKDITLHFEKAGDITLPFTVEPLAVMHGHSGMKK